MLGSPLPGLRGGGCGPGTGSPLREELSRAWPSGHRHGHCPGTLGGPGKRPASQSPGRPPGGPWGTASLLRVVPDEKPQGAEVSFGGSVVDRQGARVCGHGGVPTAVTQQPVHHLGVAEAGSQMQDCGTRTVFVLWRESPLVLKSCLGSGPVPRHTPLGWLCPQAPHWPL